MCGRSKSRNHPPQEMIQQLIERILRAIDEIIRVESGNEFIESTRRRERRQQDNQAG